MASETKKSPPKGILKKPSSGGSANEGAVTSSAPGALQKRKTTKTPDPREVAIQHAMIIHDRRLLEETITDSIILLAKLPNTLPDPSSSSPSDPAPSGPTPPNTTTTATPTPTPTPTAADIFRSHVRLFQPSDYDALIEERNALGLCGYCLCPRPRQKTSGAGTGGPYKILNWGRADFAIAPRGEVERWCSHSSSSCARRAMYVKVQLSETAAVERAGIDSIRIELLEEVEEEQRQRERIKKEKEEQEVKTREESEKQQQQQQQQHLQHESDAADTEAAGQAARDQENLRLQEETERKQKAAKNAQDLALERGDTDAEKAAKRTVSVTIREKRVVTMPVQEPSLAAPDAGGSGSGNESHLVLDGYKAKKFGRKTPTDQALGQRSCFRTTAAAAAAAASTSTSGASTNIPIREKESSAADDEGEHHQLSNETKGGS